MNPIKVYLQYPWKFPDSPYYKYLIDSPPKDVQYINVKNQKGVITHKKKIWITNILKKMIRESIRILGLPLINAHLTKSKEEYDLIHCAHCLSLNKSPWVADFESLWQLYISGKRTKIATGIIRKILLNENCKKMIMWTEKTRKEFEEVFPESANKTTVIYPALPLPKIEQKKHKGINLLFIGRSFYEKGGLDALRAMDYLTKKYNNVSAIIISEASKEILKEYNSNKRMKFLRLMPKKELENIYSISDIFIYPGYTDTFGFGILESMSWGIPSISVEGVMGNDSKSELINDGVNGFLIKKPEGIKLGKIKFSWNQATPLSEIEMKENPTIIKELIQRASLLIENPLLRKNMSQNCMEEVKKGKFSIKERNRKLEEVYKKVLNKN